MTYVEILREEIQAGRLTRHAAVCWLIRNGMKPCKVAELLP